MKKSGCWDCCCGLLSRGSDVLLAGLKSDFKWSFGLRRRRVELNWNDMLDKDPYCDWFAAAFAAMPLNRLTSSVVVVSRVLSCLSFIWKSIAKNFMFSSLKLSFSMCFSTIDVVMLSILSSRFLNSSFRESSLLFSVAFSSSTTSVNPACSLCSYEF